MKWNFLFCGHAMPLVLVSVSCDTNSVTNGTTAFVRSRQLHEVQHYCFGHLTPLMPVLVSCDADGIFNTSNVFIWSRSSKWCATWIFGHVMPLALALASCDPDGILNSTIAFVRLRWLKQGATQLFWSCDAVGIKIDSIVFIWSRQSKSYVIWLLVMWWHWHCHQCPMLPMPLSMEPFCLLGWDHQNKVWHVT